MVYRAANTFWQLFPHSLYNIWVVEGEEKSFEGLSFFKRARAEDNNVAPASSRAGEPSGGGRVEGRDGLNKEEFFKFRQTAEFNRSGTQARAHLQRCCVLVPLNPPHITNILSIGKQ